VFFFLFFLHAIFRFIYANDKKETRSFIVIQACNKICFFPLKVQ